MSSPVLRVYRYRLLITDVSRALLPAGARVLSVGPPRDGSDWLDLWAEVDPGATPVDRDFLIVGTGHPLPERGEFIGTVTTHRGALVWHVYHAPPEARGG